MVESTQKEVEIDLENKLQISRKLASVQTISSINEIENTDMDICGVLGWKVITRRNEFKINDTIFYFEIDSKLPDERWSAEMALYDFRVKTVEVIYGVISQGLIKPLSIIKNHEFHNLKVGDDATELLDVTKYLEEEEIEDVKENNAFPKFLIPITDEPRIQSEPGYMKLFEGKEYVATLKYDGTSSSFVLNPEDSNELWVCSRNTLKDPKKKDDYQKIATKYKIKEKLMKNKHLAIQGEIYGPKIQKNLLGIKENTLAVFNIYDLNRKRCLDYSELVETCEKNTRITFCKGCVYWEI